MPAALLLATIALLLVDWRQTLTIFRRGRRELHPVIRWAHGRWGTRGIDAYFACWVAAVLVVDAFVPYGFVFAAVVAVVQAVVVVRNWRRGIRP